MTIDEYWDFWSGPAGRYALGRVVNDDESYVILDQVEHKLVLIEDDRLYCDVIRRMLEAGVAVVGTHSKST